MNGNDEPIHPIGVVAERTGLSPDVLRIWERRYGVVAPGRAGTRRLYSDADIERLQLLSAATAGGRSIGQVATLSVTELRRIVENDERARSHRLREEAPSADEHVAAAMELVQAMDGAGLDALLRRSAALLGATPFFESVIAPLFARVGAAWHDGELTVAGEHAATAVALRVVSSLRSLASARPNAPLLVVGAPEGDHHELGAQMVAAAAELEGWRVAYLGAHAPAAELARTATTFHASGVALSVTYVGEDGAAADALCVLRALVPAHIAVLAGGGAVKELEECANVVALPDVSALRAWLRASST